MANLLSSWGNLIYMVLMIASYLRIWNLSVPEQRRAQLPVDRSLGFFRRTPCGPRPCSLDVPPAAACRVRPFPVPQGCRPLTGSVAAEGA